MAGIRLTHPTARNCRFNVTEPGVQYDTPIQCLPPTKGGCGQVHIFKTHHLNIDDQGSTIINEPLYKKLRRHLELNGFVVANTVRKPPVQTIGTSAADRTAFMPSPNVPIIEGKVLTDG